MKYFSLLLLFVCFSAFSQSEVDSFYVKTRYNHILDNGRMTYKKLPVNQKTFNKQGQIVREVYYIENDILEDYELYYHYHDNINYLIEKYKNGQLIAYSVLKYKKGALKQKTTYKKTDENNLLLGTIKQNNKKGINTIKESAANKELIYSRTVDATNALHKITHETFNNSDTILSKVKHDYYSGTLKNPDKTTEIINYKHSNDTVEHTYSINIKGNIDEMISTHTLNKKIITTRYTYFPKGEIKKYYSIDEKRKYTEYVEYDLKKYYRDIPTVEPSIKK